MAFQWCMAYVLKVGKIEKNILAIKVHQLPIFEFIDSKFKFLEKGVRNSKNKFQNLSSKAPRCPGLHCIARPEMIDQNHIY
jgi:hypothetical protein